MKNHFVTKTPGSHITVSSGPAVINRGDGSTLCPIQGRRLIACAIRLIHCPNDGVSALLDTGWCGGPAAPDPFTPLAQFPPLPPPFYSSTVLVPSTHHHLPTSSCVYTPGRASAATAATLMYVDFISDE